MSQTLLLLTLKRYKLGELLHGPSFWSLERFLWDLEKADAKKPSKTDQGHCGGNLGEGILSKFPSTSSLSTHTFLCQQKLFWKSLTIRWPRWASSNSLGIYNKTQDISYFKPISEKYFPFSVGVRDIIALAFVIISSQWRRTGVRDSTIICTDAGSPTIQKNSAGQCPADMLPCQSFDGQHLVAFFSRLNLPKFGALTNVCFELVGK